MKITTSEDMLNEWLQEHNTPTIFEERKNAKYCGKTIRVLHEYLFNTATWHKEFDNYNISEEYLQQTVKFLNKLLEENES